MNIRPVYLIESQSNDKMPVFLTVKHHQVLPAIRASKKDKLKDVFSWEWSSDCQLAIKFVNKHSAQMVLSMIKDKAFVSEHIFY